MDASTFAFCLLTGLVVAAATAVGLWYLWVMTRIRVLQRCLQDIRNASAVRFDLFDTFDSEEVLLWYDGPRTMTVRDRSGNLYLAHQCDEESGKSVSWLVVPIPEERLQALKANQITLLSCLTLPDVLYRVVQGYQGELHSVKQITLDSLLEDELPKPGVKLHHEECEGD